MARQQQGRGVGMLALLLADLSAAAMGPASVQHTEGELQLFGGNTDSGRIGIYHVRPLRRPPTPPPRPAQPEPDVGGCCVQEGRWGAVCSDAWGLEEATVACRMLGFELSFQAMQMPAPADSPVFLSSVRCSGTESSLLDCAARRWEAGNCSADDSVGVSCLAAGISDPYDGGVAAAIDQSLERLRLAMSVTQSSAAPAVSDGAPAGSGPCTVRSGVPLPFETAAASYVFGDQLAPFFEEQDQRSRRLLCDEESGEATQSGVLESMSTGVRVNAFGIDPAALFGFVPPWGPGIPATTASVSAVPAGAAAALQTLRNVYLAGDGLSGLHWQIDRRGEPSGHSAAPLDLRSRQLLDTLQHEGFVALTAEDLGINLPSLQDEARTLLAFSGNRSIVSSTNLGAVRSARGRLPSLEPALRSPRVSAIVRGYLGVSRHNNRCLWVAFFS